MITQKQFDTTLKFVKDDLKNYIETNDFSLVSFIDELVSNTIKLRSLADQTELSWKSHKDINHFVDGLCKLIAKDNKASTISEKHAIFTKIQELEITANVTIDLHNALAARIKYPIRLGTIKSDRAEVEFNQNKESNKWEVFINDEPLDNTFLTFEEAQEASVRELLKMEADQFYSGITVYAGQDDGWVPSGINC